MNEPQWITQNNPAPKEPGMYAVMIKGDRETIDGHVIYDFPEYQTFGQWTPAKPDELENFEGGHKGSWHCCHDEEATTIFAYYGPLKIPPYGS